jgi:hypothetical protein
MSSLSREHSSSAIRHREGQRDRTTRARRRLDLLAAAGLATVAAATGAVALAARGGGRAAHVTPAQPKPVLAASAVGVTPGVIAAAHAGAAVSKARVASEALAHNAARLRSVGTGGQTAVLLKALPPRRVPVAHNTAPPTGVVAAPPPAAPTPTYTAPVQTTPTDTPPVQTAPTYTAPAAPTPTPTPTAPPSSGGGSTGGGSGSSGSGGSGSVSGGG